MKDILVIGAGLGGLSAALRLVKKGFNVKIVEKYHQAGGRLNQIKRDGFTFDMAPTFFSMSYEFKEFVHDCNISMPFEFIELNPLYSVNFSRNNKSYHIYKDLRRLVAEFESIEPDFERKTYEYLNSAKVTFHDTIDVVVKQNFDSKLDYLKKLSKVPLRNVPKMMRTVWDELSRYYKSDDVKEIFSLVAFFLGSTPFDTPAVYTLLSYTELIHDGYYNVKGGMYKITEGILHELKKEKVDIFYNTEVVDYIEGPKGLKAFIDNHGKKWTADAYVVNSDAAFFRNKVFKRKEYSDQKLAQMKWTLAPFCIYLGVKGKVPNIHHHNYFLGNNFREYASKIFINSINLDRPYYYVNVNSKLNPECAPEGCESMFILCPMADLRYKSDWSDKEKIAENVIRDLSTRIGYDLEANQITKVILTPEDWQNTFNLYKGSGLSLAHNLMQIGAFRPKNFDEQYSNVFYVGASTVPGTGLPMAIISSKLTVERILKKYGTV